MNEVALPTLTSLCKRRGFIFQSSEIYGGLKSCYDFGPLGVELKRNIANRWWRHMVNSRDDVVGLDASIMMHPDVWRASGHLAGFSDPLVDCNNCKERFRADKAPKIEVGQQVTYKNAKKETITAVASRDYVCPVCGGCDLSPERQFNLMFRTHLGPVDYTDDIVKRILELPEVNKENLREVIDSVVSQNAIYLRPETAQAMFVQFLNVLNTTSQKVPFGIAQIGKSFRNEIITEKFIFRTAEFEQMEMEYFIPPGEQDKYLDYWSTERLKWWREIANTPENFQKRAHEPEELAHYASGCYDIEYMYPWGFDELEGVASRTDYDLKKHTEHSGVKLQYFDPNRPHPETGKLGYSYTPYVIEPAAGLTRGVLAYLCDSYRSEAKTDAEGKTTERVYLKLHPEIAPIKAAILPLTKKDGLPEVAQQIFAILLKKGINAKCDENSSIGKRYAKHDEIGTPVCVTIDHDTLSDNAVTVRDRDTMQQTRVDIDQWVEEFAG